MWKSAYLNPICVGRDLEWRCICVASGFGLLCMAVIAPLMAWRVIPFFVMRGRDGSADSHAYGRGQWQLGAGVLAVARLLLGWKPGMAVALAVAGLLLTIKIVPALSVLLHFFTAMWWRRKGQLNGRRSHRLHLSVFSHMLLIVLLAKAMFYLHW